MRASTPRRAATIFIFVTVLIDTSQTREIERMDEPSQSIVKICTRVSSGSLFMRAIYTAC